LFAFIRAWKISSRALDNKVMRHPDQSVTEATVERLKPIESNSAALKEWAVVCKALEEGRQVILLRKGGIREYRQGFELMHSDFFLYPTFEHQSKESLQPDYLDNLDIVSQNAPVNSRNRITSFASVVQAKEITDKSVLGRLEKYHIWNDRYINVRMSYNPKRPLSVLVLRVYKLNNPLEIDIRPEILGCKSWIPIRLLLSATTNPQGGEKTQREYNKEPVSAMDMVKDECQPVFSESEFTGIVAELEGVLNQ